MRLIDADKLEPSEAYINGGFTRIVYMDDIDEMPTADAEPVRHGRWEKMRDRDGVYWACSECGEDIPRIAIYDPRYSAMRLITIDKTKFCPECGAKMDEVEDG